MEGILSNNQTNVLQSKDAFSVWQYSRMLTRRWHGVLPGCNWGSQSGLDDSHILHNWVRILALFNLGSTIWFLRNCYGTQIKNKQDFEWCIQ